MSAERPYESTHESGFTLIEMLISILILTIIMAPLVSAFALGLVQSASEAQKITNSSDAQNVASIFSSDVASSDHVSTTALCGGGGTPVVQFAWSDGSTKYYVLYSYRENTSAESEQGTSPLYELDRIDCTSTGGVSSELPVAQTLVPISATPLVVAQLNLSGAACPGASATTYPLNVTLNLQDYGKPPDSNYSFSVSGTRKVTSCTG